MEKNKKNLCKKNAFKKSNNYVKKNEAKFFLNKSFYQSHETLFSLGIRTLFINLPIISLNPSYVYVGKFAMSISCKPLFIYYQLFNRDLHLYIPLNMNVIKQICYNMHNYF